MSFRHFNSPRREKRLRDYRTGEQTRGKNFGRLEAVFDFPSPSSPIFPLPYSRSSNRGRARLDHRWMISPPGVGNAHDGNLLCIPSFRSIV